MQLKRRDYKNMFRDLLIFTIAQRIISIHLRSFLYTCLTLLIISSFFKLRMLIFNVLINLSTLIFVTNFVNEDFNLINLLMKQSTLFEF